ncbi:MAG: glycosyltransferase family 2 protein, partial [Chloroflexi bacterium]|nr:glycosyltransferase family 2 protein [Chloroflexota bacterium]
LCAMDSRRLACMIVSFDSDQTLLSCIGSLNITAYELNYYLTIINNGPLASKSDYLCRFLSSWSLSVVPYEPGRGFGAACNAGSLVAPITPFVLLINPDAEITAPMIDRLLSAFDDNPSLGIASPQLVTHTGSHAATAGTFPTLLGLAAGKFVRPAHQRPHQGSSRDTSLQQTYHPVDWVSGAVMMIRREAWDAVGGFDPSFFLYYEDIDLCRRVRAAGWEVGIVPDATAIHESGGSQWRPGTRTRVERIYFESQAYYFRKHYGRLMEWLLRAVRFPYLATSLRRRFLERHGVRIRVDNDPA